MLTEKEVSIQVHNCASWCNSFVLWREVARSSARLQFFVKSHGTFKLWNEQMVFIFYVF